MIKFALNVSNFISIRRICIATCTSKLLAEASITMSEYEYAEKFHFQDSLLICNFTLSQTSYYLAELLPTVIPARNQATAKFQQYIL